MSIIDIGCYVLITVIVIGALAQSAANRNRLAQQKEKARQLYQGVLQDLKNNPTDPDLEQKTLQLGRVYSNLTRNKQGVTIFDEMALMNDINAATAKATVQAIAPAQTAVATQNIAAQDPDPMVADAVKRSLAEHTAPDKTMSKAESAGAEPLIRPLVALRRALVIAVIILLLVAFITTALVSDQGGTDLGSSKWDLYFECTARQRDAGYSLLDAAQRCKVLRPE